MKKTFRLTFVFFLQDFSIYFTKAEDLLEIFTEMEEKSLPLVEKSQQTSAILDELKTKLDTIRFEHERQTAQFQNEIDQLTQTVEQAKQREVSCRTLLE